MPRPRHKDEKRYTVIAQRDVRESGTTFGAFDSRSDAERCVIALATRQDIKSATIVEEE